MRSYCLVLLSLAAACAYQSSTDEEFPVPTEPGTDGHEHCCWWARIDECDNNPYWMRPVCQQSCGTSGCGVENAEECTVTVNLDGCPWGTIPIPPETQALIDAQNGGAANPPVAAPPGYAGGAESTTQAGTDATPQATTEEAAAETTQAMAELTTQATAEEATDAPTEEATTQATAEEATTADLADPVPVPENAPPPATGYGAPPPPPMKRKRN